MYKHGNTCHKTVLELVKQKTVGNIAPSVGYTFVET